MRFLSGFFIAMACTLAFPFASAAGSAWKGEVPAQARDARSWADLLDALKQNGMPYGEMAAASRMLSFFSELTSKETAYRAVIDLMDRGYPDPVNRLFVAGDLEAKGEPGFVNSYNLAKYILNHEKGMDRWAQQYYSKMDSDDFPKYQFYLAIEAYAQNKPEKDDEAISRLKKILASDRGDGSGALAERAARTLARIYFEQKHYEKALGIYTSFLLKLNPVAPSDWLEAAWSDYYLKRYPEALGMLYNLESRAAGPVISLEKYTLRALIYRDHCAVQSAAAMIGSFERDFGQALAGIKEGRSPRDFPILAQVETGAGNPYRKLLDGIAALKAESTESFRKLPSAQQALARYLYDSELTLLQEEARQVAEPALDQAAEQLVTASEHLKFLKYDVARSKYDPDPVFQERPTVTADVGTLGAFQVSWPQQGDFWRNERMNFKGVLKKQCDN